MARGVLAKKDGTSYKIIKQFTQNNFTQMEIGDVVLDYTFSLFWKVIANDGECVTLKNIGDNEDESGVTMNLRAGEFTITFCLLEET